MSDLPENEKLTATEDNSVAENEIIDDGYSEYGTVFGDPSAHNDKRPKSAQGNKKRILSLIAAFLAVAILVGGTLTVIKLIPEKEDVDTSSSAFEDITVVENEADDLNSVTVTNTQGTFKLLSETTVVENDSSDESSSDEEDEPETETTWYVEGMKPELLSQSKLETVANAAAQVFATRTIDGKTAADCGFDTPKYKVEVVSEKCGDYTILVGLDSPDGTGTYLKLESKDDIYIVDTSFANDFEFALLDLANTDSIAGISVPSDAEDYVDSSGSLTTFDSLRLSGKNFPENLLIQPNDSDSDLSAYAAYMVKEPGNRIADNVDAFLTMYQSGITVSGAYAFDVENATLAKFGLNDPDIVTTMTAAGVSRTYKFAKQADGDYAVVADDSIMVHRVAASSVTIADYKTANMYATWVYITSINELSNLTVAQGDESYSFDIVYDDDEDAEETYVITHNGKKLVASDFQDFYQIIIAMACSDFTVDKSLKGDVAATFTYTYSADGKKDVVSFIKYNETKYQYYINGEPMGKVTSADFNKIFKNVRLVSEGKAVVN